MDGKSLNMIDKGAAEFLESMFRKPPPENIDSIKAWLKTIWNRLSGIYKVAIPCDLLSESKSIIGEIVNNLPNYSAIREFLWVVVQQIWKVYRNRAKGKELPKLQEFRRMIIEPTDIVIEPQAIGLIHRDKNGNVILPN
jgi:uncharacterized Fe-S cluster-containing protein